MTRSMTLALLCAVFFPCLAPADPGIVKPGRWKTFEYEKPDTLPVIYSGESKADGVNAEEYCLYLDITYSDGSHTWGHRSDFPQGTHDWSPLKNVFVPKKPIAKIEMFALCRKGSGNALFRNLSLERREGRGDVTYDVVRTARPFAEGDEREYGVFTGRRTVKNKVMMPPRSPSPSTVVPGTVEIWVADSMRAVSPLTFPSPIDARAVSLDLARRERESTQICFSSAADTEWDGVSLRLPELRDGQGRPFDGTLEWRRVGYLSREYGYSRHPFGLPEDEKWFADPLLPPAPFRVRKGGTQGVWLTAYARPGAAAGTFRGNIVVTASGGVVREIPVSVRVRDFELPAVFGLETAYAVMDGFIRKMYPDDFTAKKREAWDIMLDHRLNPDDISRTSPPDIDDLLYARSRGMNRFNVLNIVPPPKNPDQPMVLTADPGEIFTDAFYDDFVRRARPFLEQAKAYGLDKLAYFYGFDERGRKYYKGMEEFWRKLRRDFPGVPLMSTAKNYRDMAAGRTNIAHLASGDWYCPVSNNYDMKLNEKLRAEGRKVWWYTCCSPAYPYANMASWEYPPVEARLLGWMTHRVRADGYLFWIVNKWLHPKMDGSDTYFPDYPTRNGNRMPGDGILMYPGEDSIWPSIKLANCRDAVEDYEYLKLVSQKRGTAAADAESGKLIADLTHFTRDPALVRAARIRLAEILETE